MTGLFENQKINIEFLAKLLICVENKKNAKVESCLLFGKKEREVCRAKKKTREANKHNVTLCSWE